MLELSEIKITINNFKRLQRDSGKGREHALKTNELSRCLNLKGRLQVKRQIKRCEFALEVLRQDRGFRQSRVMAFGKKAKQVNQSEQC